MSALMGGIFNMVSLFMDNSNELIHGMHKKATAFSLDDKKCKEL
jgi:hypothetical protein